MEHSYVRSYNRIHDLMAAPDAQCKQNDAHVKRLDHPILFPSVQQF